jgi:hypothetical protein
VVEEGCHRPYRTPPGAPPPSEVVRRARGTRGRGP